MRMIRKSNWFDKNDFIKIIFILLSIIIFFQIVYSIVNNGNWLYKDIWLNQSFNSNYSLQILEIAKIITNIFHPAIMITACLILGYWAYSKKDNILGNTIFIITLLAFILEQALSFIVNRERPLNALVEVSGFSFPSGHATFVTLFFLSLLFLSGIKFKGIKNNLFFVLSIFIIILVSLTRVYLNVHYLSDVIAGICLSVFIVMGASLIVKIIKSFN